MKEIVDVDFLPVLDDDDFQREKNSTHSVTEEKVYNEVIKENEIYEYSTEETVENMQEEKKEEPEKAAYEKTYEQTYEQSNAYKSYDMGDKQKKTETGERDTSYASFDTAQKQAFRKKKKKISASIANGIRLALAILIGIPIAAFVGFFAVMGIGMAVFFCGMAVGMGVLGLGLAGFTVVAGMGQIGMLCFFGSLLAIGGGGVGLCLILMIFIWIKRLCVGGYRRLKERKERGVA